MPPKRAPAVAVDPPEASPGFDPKSTLSETLSTLSQYAMSYPLVNTIANDAKVVYSQLFKPVKGGTHEERLESSYGPEAHAFDQFRARFLHAREPMLQAVARRLMDQRAVWENQPVRKGLMGKPKPKEEWEGLVWVDLGGGTGSNVEMMAQLMPLDLFKHIYVVDLAPGAVEVARRRFEGLGYGNVTVVHADATVFSLPPGEEADAVTFSYSLSMVPACYAAVDNGLELLKTGGLLAVADFGTSKKYDNPERQHGYLYRTFWRAVFEVDGINLSPEVRQYVEHRTTVLEGQSGAGTIPYMPPFVTAPWYIHIGLKPSTAGEEE